MIIEAEPIPVDQAVGKTFYVTILASMSLANSPVRYDGLEPIDSADFQSFCTFTFISRDADAVLEFDTIYQGSTVYITY
jgi:hypothetical protein